jgi:hypothetical protein
MGIDAPIGAVSGAGGRPAPGSPAADDAAMRAALAQAEQALTHGDVPVGAVALVDGEICWWWPMPLPPWARGGWMR